MRPAGRMGILKGLSWCGQKNHMAPDLSMNIDCVVKSL